MLKRFIQLGTVVVVGSMLTWAAAASPVWGLNEVYSNADRSIQFAVHSTGASGQQYLRGETLAVGGQDIQTHLFVFPSDLPGDSAGRSFLIATQGFADLNVLKPDYVVPNGFFSVSGGFISVAGHSYEYWPVPTDGTQAYWQDPDVLYWHAPAVATNFAGERYAFTGAAQVPAIGPGFTGTWFNPAQGDQGFAIEVLPGLPMQLLATWFTFAPEGGQSWIFGLGPISGDGATMQGIQAAGGGARFPPNLDPANVQIVPWGTLTFSFSDCDHGHVDWSSSVPGYGSGGMDLTRLTLPAGLTCPD